MAPSTDVTSAPTRIVAGVIGVCLLGCVSRSATTTRGPSTADSQAGRERLPSPPLIEPDPAPAVRSAIDAGLPPELDSVPSYEEYERLVLAREYDAALGVRRSLVARDISYDERLDTLAAAAACGAGLPATARILAAHASADFVERCPPSTTAVSCTVAASIPARALLSVEDRRCAVDVVDAWSAAYESPAAMSSVVLRAQAEVKCALDEPDVALTDELRRRGLEAPC